MKIGIIGNGFVGKATTILKCKNIDLLIYDINPELCVPKCITLKDLLVCEIIFICVPTPMNKDGSCYIKIINSVIENLNKLEFKNYIVLRSTVPVGTSNELNCYFMPEFLTEKNFHNDFINNQDWIFGTLSENDTGFKNTIEKLINYAHSENRIKYNKISFVSNSEAEMIKLFRNCYLATKVSFCNEVYKFCEKKQINYDTVINHVTNDIRITSSHTKIPGPDGKFGFGGTCFPKDTSNLRFEMIKNKCEPYILNAVIKRNNEIDRIEQDWNLNKGRAVI